MPRTLSTELEAVNNGRYNAIFRVKAWSNRGVTLLGQTTDVLSFEITRTELEVAVTKAFNYFPAFIQCYRGAKIDGIEYTVGSTFYKVYRQEIYRDRRKFFASLIPRQYISIAGDDTYENVLTEFCTTLGLTAQFKNPSADFWQYKFFPTGRNLALSDARGIIPLLKKKYLIQISDQENDVVQFAGYLDSTSMEIADPPIMNNPYVKFTQEFSRKRFIWRDELNTVHSDGGATDPIHNLGYLESTDNPPATYENASSSDFEGQVDLRITNDDIIFTEGEYNLQAEVTEIFSTDATDPSWKMTLSFSTPLSNTEGGAMPSTIEAAAPYTPLNVSLFNNVLSTSDNNIQAAMETIDDHDHSGVATTEGIQDIIGAMVSSNTETGIAVTYDDTNGKLDFDAQTAGDARYTQTTHDHNGGDGGTIAYTSLSGTPTAETNANDIFRVDNPGGVSLWTGTISGTPSGTSVTVSAPTSGTEAVLVPTSTSQLAKMRLYNLTRGNSALISNYNTGTNVITLTANAPAAWANGDSLTIVSQTVSGGGFNWIDLEITSGLTGKSSIFAMCNILAGAANDAVRTHPLETYGVGKIQPVTGQVAGVVANGMMLIKITSNVFSLSWSTTPTAIVVRETGYLS